MQEGQNQREHLEEQIRLLRVLRVCRSSGSKAIRIIRREAASSFVVGETCEEHGAGNEGLYEVDHLGGEKRGLSWKKGHDRAI